MAAAFALVIAPNVWWLVTHDFMPFRYVDERAAAAAHWYHSPVYPLQWTGGQALVLLPALALLALLYRRGEVRATAPADEIAAFNRRYVTALALGPFLVTTVVAAAARAARDRDVGLSAVVVRAARAAAVAAAVTDPPQLRRFAAGAIAMLLAFPVIYAAVEIGEPLAARPAEGDPVPRPAGGRNRLPTVTQKPAVLSSMSVAQWYWEHPQGGSRGIPGAGQFASNNVAVYLVRAPARHRERRPECSPSIDTADLDRRGAVLAWQRRSPDGALPENLRRAFPRVELQPPLVMPRVTVFIPGVLEARPLCVLCRPDRLPRPSALRPPHRACPKLDELLAPAHCLIEIE